MSTNTGMTLNVSEDLVRPVIEQKIQSAIVAELTKSDNGAFINGIVGRILSQKVDSDGKPSNYSYDRERSYIEWLCTKAVRECAAKAIEEWLDGNKDKMRKHIQSELAKRSESMAQVFMEGLVGAVKSKWDFKVDVEFASKKDR